ncbi:MAG: polyprenyl synthetase family protein [Campylobacterales bacterium]|nr:polyprenyl synthetase family protein [Campylobacterales bacterium]
MLEAVEAQMRSLVAEVDDGEVLRLFETLRGGKRLRAKLVLKIAPHAESSVLLAAIIELIHAASLLHDDVIDDAMVRRGVASINATEGSKRAIMLGDVLYSKAFSALTDFEQPVARCVADAVTALSKGEMQDVVMAQRFNVDAERYLQMLYFKTASLIEAAVRSAALLCGKEPERYALYGKNLGLSFQIIDDILDIVSDEATLGKPALSDYAEGKCTLPYIYLYDALNSAGQERLVALHAKAPSEADALWIKSEMHSAKAIERSYALAASLSAEAKAAVDDPALHQVLDTMLERRF